MSEHKVRRMPVRWSELYHSDKKPSFEDIERYVGKGAPLWRELLTYIENTYQVRPKVNYSKCAAQPGWNIKYQKSGKSLCTLYPMEDFFIALVVVGAKEEKEAEMSLSVLTPYVAGLFRRTPFSCGGRWLMIEVKERAVLNDVESLINIRVKPRVKI